jgi:hypothetical protein
MDRCNCDAVALPILFYGGNLVYEDKTNDFDDAGCIAFWWGRYAI